MTQQFQNRVLKMQTNNWVHKIADTNSSLIYKVALSLEIFFIFTDMGIYFQSLNGIAPITECDLAVCPVWSRGWTETLPDPCGPKP